MVTAERRQPTVWRAIVPAILGACLTLGFPAVGSVQAAEETGDQAQPAVVVVPAVPSVVYVGNIPLLLTSRQVVVVRGGARAVIVPVHGRYLINGTPVAILRPTQVIVIDLPPAPAAPET
jgi:hypothetical protein